MQSRIMTSVIQWLDKLSGINIHSIVVARKQSLIFQHYRSGHDERWRQPLGNVCHAENVKHDMRSVTRIVVGLLVGDALQRGLLPSPDSPVINYFPDYACITF